MRCRGGGRIDCDPWLIPLQRLDPPVDHEDIDRALLMDPGAGAIVFGCSMARRSACVDVGMFDESLRRGEDWDLLLRLGEVGRLHNLRDAVLLRRKHPTSLVATAGEQHVAERDRIRRAAYRRRAMGCEPPPDTNPRPMSRESLVSWWYWNALEQHRFCVAGRHLLRYLWINRSGRDTCKAVLCYPRELVRAVAGRRPAGPNK